MYLRLLSRLIILMSEFFCLVATGAITSAEEPSGVGNSRVT